MTGWFSGIWAQIKTAFSGGIAGVGRLIMNWSPLGLFCKAFAGVMKYFGIDMPKNFTDFGGNLINGLVNGIGNALTAAKETVVNFGNSISGWFKETLGIHSPARSLPGSAIISRKGPLLVSTAPPRMRFPPVSKWRRR